MLVTAVGILLSYGPWWAPLEGGAYDARYTFLHEHFDRGLHPAVRLVALDRATEDRVRKRKGAAKWTATDLERVLTNLHRARVVAVGVPGELEDVKALKGKLPPYAIPYTGPNQPADPRQAGGITEVVRDRDGVVRRAFVAYPTAAGPLPSEALLLFAALKRVPASAILYERNRIRVGSHVIHTGPNYTLTVRILDPRRLNLDDLTDELVWDALAPVSVYRLLDPEDRYFQLVPGRAVLYGDYRYLATDQIVTPMGRMRSFQLQACLLDTLVSGWRMRPAGWLLDSAILLALSGTAGLLAFRLRPLGALFGMAGLLSGFVALNLTLFFNGWNFALAQPILASVLCFLGVLVLRLMDMFGALRRFGGTVAERAARSMLKFGHRYLEEAREKEATIVFCNIPELLRALEQSGNREYFPRRRQFSELVNEICLRNRGVVLDYQGDAQMLAFGVELELEDDVTDHAYLATRAALELSEMSQRLKQLWWGVDDERVLKIRCGVATGRVAVGQVGAHSKKAQAAIGDTTNVAARLLGSARKQEVDVMVTEATRNLCGARFAFERLAPVTLKGKAVPVNVFAVKEE